MKKRIVILISGRGSNMEAIIAACAREGWEAEVACVIANRTDAGGLAIAAAAGIATAVVDSATFGDRQAFEAALVERIDPHRPDCVVLAGFMRVLSAAFVDRYEGRLLNIHPSLLPSFPGLHTHRRAIAAGVCVHGATVHFVSAVVDAGAIVAQAVVPVLDDDTPESLAARVIVAEHRLFPRAIDWYLRGDAVLVDGRVQRSPAVARDALLMIPS